MEDVRIGQNAAPNQKRTFKIPRRLIITLQTKTFKVIGQRTMNCGGCASSVKFTLGQLSGVQKVEASHKTQLIKLIYDSEALDLDRVRQELDWIGYQVAEAEAA